MDTDAHYSDRRERGTIGPVGLGGLPYTQGQHFDSLGVTMKQALGLIFFFSCVLLGAGAQAQPAFGTSESVGGALCDTSWPLEEPCSFTQNEQFDLINGAIACSSGGTTTDNQFLRVFDLDIEHGFGGQVCIDSLDYGVEVSLGSVPVTFNVYCTPQGLADDAINAGIDRDVDLDPGLVYSVTIFHPDAEFEFFNQPLGGCCDADSQDLAIETRSKTVPTTAPILRPSARWADCCSC